MTSPPPLLLRLEPGISEELRLALRQEPGELPSDDAIGALRARLADRVGPATRLRDRALLGEEPLQRALRDHFSEFPSDEQLRVLARRVASKRNAARPPRATPAARRMRAAVVAACLLIACVAAAASYWASRARQRPIPTPSESSSSPRAGAILREPAVEPAPSQEEPVPAATTETVAGPHTGRDPPRALSSAVAQGPSELQLLREAQRLQASDPAAALAVVARHQRLFPSGVLAQERELVAVDALTRLGRSEAARARAAAFLRQYPGSVHALRIRELVRAPASSSSVRAPEPLPAPVGSAPIFSP